MTALTYTVRELAAVLQVSEATVRRMVKAGSLPTLAIPGRTLFSRVAIDQWMRSAA